MIRRALAVFGLGLVVWAVAACGGGGDGDGGVVMPGHGGGMTATEMAGHGGGAGPAMADVTIEIDARDTRFVPDEIEVPAGKLVKLVLKNSDVGTDHDLQAGTLDIRVMDGGAMGEEHGGGGVLALHAAEGEESAIVFVADTRGTYEIFCTVDDHREQGMIGTIRVV